MKELYYEAVRYLAGVCDGAQEQDGAGFAKGDSYNGKFLAATPLSSWEEEEIDLARYFASKYRKQVAHIVTVEATFNQDAADKVSYKRRKVYNKPVATAKYENGLIITDTPWGSVDKTFVDEGKKINSRKWIQGSLTSFNPKDMKEVLELCDKYNIEVQFNPDEVTVQPVAAPVTKPVVVAQTKRLIAKNKKLAVYFPFSYEELDFIKSLKIAAFDKENKCWWVEAVHAQRLVDALTPRGYEIDPSVANLAFQSIHNKANYNVSTTDYRAELPELLPEYVVLPHQWVPIEWAIKNNNMLNADSQGLGKTFVTLTTAIIKKSKKMVVICPSSLTGNWDAESQMFYTEGTFTVFHAEGRTVSDIPDGVNLVIVGWPNLSFWLDAINAWKADTIVVDEAHYGKSGNKSARGKAFISLGKKNKKAMKLALTGTPILNRPLELLAILMFFTVESMFGGATKFKYRYCGPETINTEWGSVTTFNGAENLEELHDILTSSGIYVRRTKKLLIEQGLLKNKYVNGVEFFSYDVPRIPTYLKLTDAEALEYKMVESEFKNSIKEKQREIAKKMGLHVNDPRVVNAITSNKGGEALTLLNEFRKKIGILKIRAISEEIAELVAKGEKVVVFAHHREVVDAYAALYSGIKIQGGMGSKKIEDAKKKFNATPIEEHPVLVVSIEAGKTGHTLCLQKKYGVGKSCRHAIFAEEPYVYGDAEQAEDRIYRIGQDREVFIDNLMVKDTVDDRIYYIREKKRKVFNAVIDGVTLDDDEEAGVTSQILRGYI